MTKTAGNYKKIEMFEKIKLKTANLRTKPTNFILWAMMFTVYTEPMSAIYIYPMNESLLIGGACGMSCSLFLSFF